MLAGGGSWITPVQSGDAVKAVMLAGCHAATHATVRPYQPCVPHRLCSHPFNNFVPSTLSLTHKHTHIQTQAGTHSHRQTQIQTHKRNAVTQLRKMGTAPGRNASPRILVTWSGSGWNVIPENSPATAVYFHVHHTSIVSSLSTHQTIWARHSHSSSAVAASIGTAGGSHRFGRTCE